MFLGLKKKQEEEPRSAADRASQLEQSEKRREFLLQAAQALLADLRQFALDLREVPYAAFRQELADLAERLAAEEKLGRLERLFDSRQRSIQEFVRRQNECLKTREAELKEIIDILTKAMAVLDNENREYNHSIMEQGRRLEELTHLEDIRRLKQSLLQEVEQLRRAVQAKESRDGAKIQSLAKQVAVLNTELQQVRTESERDGLTGVYNRRSFDRFLSDLLAKRSGADEPFSLLMIDIDNFKRLNDSFGHPAGDSVLSAVARKCRQLIRIQDFLARYGGEEFAVVLSGAGLRDAVKKGRQICEAIAATRYVLEGSGRQQPLALSVSIGVSVSAAEDTPSALVGRADKALYLAKASGKNCVRSEKESQ
ncbi:MAG: diguanylate cyclase [Desulfobacterales bacterium]|jgi:diguanylate cyclase|nr:diguanylate cyclase [Desulfobacterales bacterium]